MCKKNCSNCNKLYIFENPLTQGIQIYKDICKVSVQKSVQNFFAKFVQSACFYYRLSKELYNVEVQSLEVCLNIDLVWYR